MSGWGVRPLRTGEYPLMPSFLYAAVYQGDREEPLPFGIVHLPALKVYTEGFGRPGDLCLVAEAGGNLVGAVWTRLFPEEARGYGWVDSQTPELAIGIQEPWRGQGLGTALVKRMLDLLSEEGFGQVSLSVQQNNPAVRLYRRLGFTVLREEGEDYLMLRSL